MQELSYLEQKVLKLILAEYSLAQIAPLVDRSQRSVERIKYRIMKKLQVTTVVGLVKHAVENGWLDEKIIRIYPNALPAKEKSQYPL